MLRCRRSGVIGCRGGGFEGLCRMFGAYTGVDLWTLGFQRTDRQSLKCPIGDHRNPESAPFSVCFAMNTRLTGLGFHA